MKKCSFCDAEAKHKIEGWAEDGLNDGPVFSLACEVHAEEFRQHDFEGGPLRGYEYIDGVEPL